MRSLRLVGLGLLLVACDRGPTEPNIAVFGRRLAVGELTACALTVAGGLRCWGANTQHFEYGTPVGPSTTPQAIANGITLTALSSGAAQFMCGIVTQQNKGACWGRGGLGQMGAGVEGTTGNVAAVMPNEIRWSSVAVGRLTACGVDAGGVVRCWGFNQRGEIGNNTVARGSRVTSPTAISSTNAFSRVAVGWQHGCAITTGRDLYCWGDNREGQLGIGSTDTVRLEPTLVASSHKWIDVATGGRSTCAIAADSTAWCWGLNYTGQLGDGTTTTRRVPTAVAMTARFMKIEMSSGFGGGGVAPTTPPPQAALGHTCALKGDSTAVCWGWNANGQLGDGTTTDRLTPVAVQGGERFETLGLGGAATCGMNGDYIWCWGSNVAGQLGNGSTTDSSSPAKVAAPFMKP